MEHIVRTVIEHVALGIEMLAVAIMAGFVLFGTARWFLKSGMGLDKTYERYRSDLGRALLLGLELLVAADIIRTVALELTLLNVATLAALVAVRTFLSWALTVEVEGNWPWKRRGAFAMTPRAGEKESLIPPGQ